ncbi:hypothetical protein Cob_v002311 [Colletotrichum orbiculare MAFF 240422]|uniref:Uncharacterized protein n=1 Tax=Colletotrichum orbiculare (strain 104-T / ATCC 96160 / CBS 514.97 / LARS 414 / MAFF 240422) TaxID=1213857 RepID=A0A484G380_COLOR|nr:hypothetical protein Cob_v002311 [Colletotrichum orbiculare MAFF 240422]
MRMSKQIFRICAYLIRQAMLQSALVGSSPQPSTTTSGPVAVYSCAWLLHAVVACFFTIMLVVPSDE